MRSGHTISMRSQIPAKARGFTLVECLIALVTMSSVSIAVLHLSATAHQQINYSDTIIRSARLCEQLVEEIVSRPYGSNGTDRQMFCVDDYAAFEENAGGIEDARGERYMSDEQLFSRKATISSANCSLDSLGGHVVHGRIITITVIGADGRPYTLSRIICEPGGST